MRKMPLLLALAALAFAWPASAQRVRPTAPMKAYVKLPADGGSDANTAFGCDIAHQCETLQKASDWVFENIDPAGQPFAIELACPSGGGVARYGGVDVRGDIVGHYGAIDIPYPLPDFVATFTIQGAPSCPPTFDGAGHMLSGVLIDGALNAAGPGAAISTLLNKSMHIHNLALTAPANSPCVQARFLSEFNVHLVAFMGCSDGVYASTGSIVNIACPCIVTGTYAHLVYAELGAWIFPFGVPSIQMQGATTITDFGFGVARGARIECGGGGFAFGYGAGAAVTGQKWRTLGGVISGDCGPSGHLDPVFPGTIGGANVAETVGTN